MRARPIQETEGASRRHVRADVLLLTIFSGGAAVASVMLSVQAHDIIIIEALATNRAVIRPVEKFEIASVISIAANKELMFSSQSIENGGFLLPPFESISIMMAHQFVNHHLV